jgi:hypothetical protein
MPELNGRGARANANALVMTEDRRIERECKRVKRRERDKTPEGRAVRQRERERVRRGYNLLREQGISIAEAKRRARAAYRELVADVQPCPRPKLIPMPELSADEIRRAANRMAQEHYEEFVLQGFSTEDARQHAIREAREWAQKVRGQYAEPK